MAKELDVSIAYSRYRFLGFEFLTWLWFMIETASGSLFKEEDGESARKTLAIGNRIVLEILGENQKESITIKGDDAGLEEGILSLRKGAVVTEMNLILRIREHEFRFGIKGENLNISNLKTPDTPALETQGDMEGILLEKAFLYEQVIMTVEGLFETFLTFRLQENWDRNTLSGIRQWIYS